jgi:hypothetical protein
MLVTAAANPSFQTTIKQMFHQIRMLNPQDIRFGLVTARQLLSQQWPESTQYLLGDVLTAALVRVHKHNKTGEVQEQTQLFTPLHSEYY